MSEHTRRQSDLGWVARWVGLAATVLAIVTVAVSCQERKGAEAQLAAQTETAADAPVAEGEAAAPAADAGPMLPDAKALGFSYPSAPANPGRPADEVAAQNKSCVACHTASDTHTMHATDIAVTCVDCHGGNWDVPIPETFTENFEEYERFKHATHVRPKHPHLWETAAGKETARNPEIMGAASNEEHQDYIRFINPGDLRAAEVSCGACHNTEADGYIIDRVRTNMMTHGGMLWGAALYNNGTHNIKDPIYGEFYTESGEPARVVPNPRVTKSEMRYKGRLPQMWPLPRWEVSQPGNILRVFERGGRLRPQIALPNPNPPQGGQAGIDDPGRPEVKLSVRGYGTDLRTDPVLIGLQKTRLMDPTLNFMGTNNHPGDYRASGCSACHVVYANDRSPVHSAQWSKFGNMGESFSKDPTVNPPVNGVAVTEASADAWKPTEPAREAGHPIQHTFVKNAPTSNCITCHMHPGTLVLNSYLGVMWWDNESDGAHMYPKKQKYPTADDFFEVTRHNPEGSATRGLWSNRYPDDVDHTGEVAGPNFLEKIGTPEFNAKLKNNHFADFHGHGWIFRAVFKQDRKGNLLDHNGDKVEKTPESMKKGVEFAWQKSGDNPPDGAPVHLKDIHLERGMHCVDCHFETDVHGDGHLYGETRNATMINCEDCHGTMEAPSKIVQYFKLATKDQNAEKGQNLLFEMMSGNAGPRDRKSVIARNKKLLRKFKWNAPTGTLTQNAQVGDQKWIVDQTSDTSTGVWKPDVAGPPKKAGAPPKQVKLDTTDPNERRSILARFAHTIRRDGKTWGGDPAADTAGTNEAMKLAHGSDTMSCYACHTSWNTSCFGCHLPQRANQRRDMLHNEGQTTRNYTNYNFQTLRDDVFMLGVDSTVKGHKIVPIRSACAVMVSSQDALRQWIYPQQQTVSAEGFSGTAFSPYFPHTVRAVETKQCTDCHVSNNGDNNAVMAQVLLQGTNSVNFIGRFAWVGMGKKGMEAIAVTERDEPQAVIGSKLHKYAYPDFYVEHERNHHALKTAHEHHGTVYDLVQRGEYVYTACGPEGFRAYDIASLDNKGFSERIVTAPVSPVGQVFKVDTKFATSVTTPTTMGVDPTRPRRPQNEEGKITEIGKPGNVIEESKPIHLMYAFLYVTDRDEGLVVIGNPLTDKRNKPGVATLLDGDPDNNFIKRAYAYNPDGRLTGATDMEFYGTLAYVTSSAGVTVIDFDNPLEPKVVAELSQFDGPRKIQFQFRYGFVLDNQGMHVIDVTDPRNPQVVSGASIPMGDARDIYISRTYAYVAAGNQGLVIIDVTRPEKPRVDQIFDAEGHMNDATAVKVGMTNSSQFAYVGDGKNGLKVLQLTDEDTPGYMGFSPRPTPRLIAEKHTHGPALAIGEGLDRDRAVDESGNQLSVFGRRGARPFTWEEQRRLFMLRDADGNRTQLYTVTDFPTNQPVTAKSAAGATEEEGTGGPRRPGGRRGPRAGAGPSSEAAPADAAAPAEGEAAPAETPKRRGPRRPGAPR